MKKKDIKIIFSFKFFLTAILTLMKLQPNGLLQDVDWIWIMLPIWFPILMLLVYGVFIVVVTWFTWNPNEPAEEEEIKNNF